MSFVAPSCSFVRLCSDSVSGVTTATLRPACATSSTDLWSALDDELCHRAPAGVLGSKTVALQTFFTKEAGSVGRRSWMRPWPPSNGRFDLAAHVQS
ncbi:hypothetical protein MRX96_033312 [Rhipicephalus microplus]